MPRRAALGAAALLLTAGSLPTATAARALPAAPGQARICTSDLTNFDDQPTITLPAGLVFAAWGRAAGDLRMLRLDPNYPPARPDNQTAFVTTAPVSLTAAAPCALAPARALLSERRAWRGPALSPADGLVFQPVDTLGPNGIRSLGQEELTLASLLAMNILTASPAGPIGEPVNAP
jgi:hypothetical protein